MLVSLFNRLLFVTGFNKTPFSCTVTNADFNYLNCFLKYFNCCNSGRETVTCIKISVIL